MHEMEKLYADELHKLGKSKTNFTKKVSIPQQAYEMCKEDWEKSGKQIRTFGKKYKEKIGV
jgi:hypothetical protein